MLFYYLNVFLILLTWSSQVVSETAFQKAVDSLNPCANNCIARAASFNGCAANDFNCQCTNAGQDKIIGPDKKASSQGACIFKDCGARNATDVRSTFGTICNDILADHASSASAAQATTTTQASVVTPNPVTTTQVIVSTTAVIVPTTLPAPSPTTTTTPISVPATSQAPASFITVTAIPTSSPPENTLVTAESLASASTSTPAIFTTPAVASSDPDFSPFESAALSSAPTSTSAQAVQASSIAESNPPTTPSPPSSKKRLPPLAIAGITTLVIGFVATILFLISFQLRRRKRKSYIADRPLGEKLRPGTEDGPSSPPSSAGRGLPWDGKGKNKISTIMGIEIGPRPKSKPTGGEEERPKSRGKGAGESAGGGPKPPTSFPIIGTGTPQGVDTRSPPGTGNSMRVGTGGIAGSAQPLKSAMKKPRDRPKSRPLIVGEGGEIKFGFDPLGSNPRSPT